MAVDDSRLREIEAQIHELDKRQTGFEVRFDMYMRKTDELIRLQREQTDKMDAKMDNLSAQMHSMAVSFEAGTGAILVAMFVALFLTK